MICMYCKAELENLNEYDFCCPNDNCPYLDTEDSGGYPWIVDEDYYKELVEEGSIIEK